MQHLVLAIVGFVLVAVIGVGVAGSVALLAAMVRAPRDDVRSARRSEARRRT